MALKIDKIKSQASEISNKASSGINTLNGVISTMDSMKNSILKNKTVDTTKINEVTGAVSSAFSTAENIMDSLTNIKSQIPDVSGTISSKLSTAENEMKTAKNAIDNIKKKSGGILSSKKTKVVDEEESDVFNQINLSKEEAMSYDSNGMKHFMNVWMDIMSSEGIPYSNLGMRRWAVTSDDEKVYGNAFLMKESSQTFKTLDSDGKLYWLSDYNSRHYYGEAVDITGDLQTILDKVAKSDNVLDAMHKFGICIQIETSESGQSKGTHFHCSTDPDNPQTKFWGVVNRIRETNDLPLYTVVVNSDYYEKETKNTTKFG